MLASFVFDHDSDQAALSTTHVKAGREACHPRSTYRNKAAVASE